MRQKHIAFGAKKENARIMIGGNVNKVQSKFTPKFLKLL